MAWYNSLKDLTGDVKKGTTTVGHAVGDVASNPWVQGLTAAALAATGVGAPAAAAILAAEKGGGALLKPGGNIGTAVKQGAIGAAEGAGASLAGNVLRSGGVGDALGGLKGLVQKGASTLGGDLGGLVGGAANALNGATGGGSLAQKALLASAIADAAATKQRQQSLQDQGLKYATDAYTANAPVRALGLTRITAPTTPDLSGIFGNSPNPYAKNYSVAPLGPKVPVAAASPTAGATTGASAQLGQTGGI